MARLIRCLERTYAVVSLPAAVSSVDVAAPKQTVDLLAPCLIERSLAVRHFRSVYQQFICPDETLGAPGRQPGDEVPVG